VEADFLGLLGNQKAVEENRILSEENRILGEDFRKEYSGRNIIVRKPLLPDDALSSGNVRMDLLDLDWFFITS
jgi:hypothetical protein